MPTSAPGLDPSLPRLYLTTATSASGRGLAYPRQIVQLEDLLRTRGGCAHVDVIAGSVGEDGSAHPVTHGNHH
jgi:hypothetical protein